MFEIRALSISLLASEEQIIKERGCEAILGWTNFLLKELDRIE
jgi:hypothetical protein